MKDFFSEYGWVVIVGIVIAGVIVFATPFGQSIQTAVTSFITSFSSKVTSTITAIGSGS